ncbi:MAG: N-acetylmuramoyl-L-alanine amidase [Syntrophobacteraceae bacterium]
MRLLRALPIICILATSLFAGQRPALARAFSVAVDTGHSRETVGTISARNRPEYEYNRKMALLVCRELNKNPRIRAFPINPDGEDITLQRRAELINQARPDLLISIHHDSVRPDYLSNWTHRGVTAQFCDKYWGYAAFISDKNGQAKASRSFAAVLGERMRKAGFIPSAHHLEMAEREGRQPVDAEKGIYRYDNLVVLKDVKYPALLLECGIIKNRSEELLLRNRAYRLRMARAVRSAVELFAERRGR